MNAADNVRVVAGALVTPYTSLYQAFGAVKSGEKVYARSIMFTEGLPVTVTTATGFKGGFNAAFDPASTIGNFTILKGVLKIAPGGYLSVERLKIMP